MTGDDRKKQYSACLRCTQTCYRTHGMANFNGSYFFKIMVNNFKESLKIPPKFVEQIKDRMGLDVILEGPSGQLWQAELCCMGTVMTIEHGWKNFVSDHAIEYGDFLVFKYCGNSHFIVQIFEKSGCEKRSAFTVTSIESFSEGKNLNQEQQDKMKNFQSPIFLDNNLLTAMKDKTKEDCTGTKDSAMQCTTMPDDKMDGSVTRKILSATAPTECIKMLKTDRPVKYVESLKHTIASYKHEVKSERNETEKYDYQHAIGRKGSHMALRVKELMNKIEGPHFLVDMKKTHLVPSFRLAIPLDFTRKWLPKSKAEITLLGPDKVQWSVTFPGENAVSPGLRGWRDFAVNYNLKLQDICIFELVNKQLMTLEVHLLRTSRFGRKKGFDRRIECKTPKLEDFKLTSQKIQRRIKDERDFLPDFPLISRVASYQMKLPKQEKCSEKLLKQGCQGGNKLLNGEENYVSTVMMDQKPYFLRGDLRRTWTGPNTAGSHKNGMPTQNIPCSNVIVLE